MSEETQDENENTEERPSEEIVKEDTGKKAEEYLDGWKRCLADFDNYKKQQAKFLEEIRTYATEDLIRELVPILDSFELALKAVPEGDLSREWKKGVIYIQGQLEEVLKARGLERIHAFGEKFNPEIHEAIESVESDKESGSILEELQPGYTMRGKVVRPARVKVAK